MPVAGPETPLAEPILAAKRVSSSCEKRSLPRPANAIYDFSITSTEAQLLTPRLNNLTNPGLDLARIIYTTGAPLFAYFAKSGNHEHAHTWLCAEGTLLSAASFPPLQKPQGQGRDGASQTPLPPFSEFVRITSP
jgi:hypothetical protein